MKIIIIGVGKVGYTLAKTLSGEKNDVVVIDKSSEALEKAEDNLDVLCIKGNGVGANTLFESGINDADLLIAVTGSDEINMVCCLTAKRLGVKHTAARIRDPQYAKELLLLKEQIGIDLIINPEHAAADEIVHLINFSPAINIENFAGGRVKMAGIKITSDMPIIGQKLRDYFNKNQSPILIGAVSRDNKIIIPKGDFEIRDGDIAYIIGKHSSIYNFCKSTGKYSQKYKNAMILGGGRITYYLTVLLTAMGMKVKIIEIDPKKCEELSEVLDDVLIINADGTDEEVLLSENISDMDCFIAVTGVDEENLLSSLMAKQNGVKKVIAKISRISYMNVVDNLSIDNIVNPKLITVNQILKFTRGNNIESLYKIIEGQAEIGEYIIKDSSCITGKPIKSLGLLEGTIIATIVRRNEIVVPKGNDVIKKGDRVIIITKNGNLENIDECSLGLIGEAIMNFLIVLKSLGILLACESLAMIPSLIVSILYGDGDALSFVYTMLILFMVGIGVAVFARPKNKNIYPRDGFAIVALGWILVSFFGSLPFIFSGVIPSLVDAFFETSSGFTTTGATIMTNVEGLPHGVMFWRSFTHWIGGMGVLLFALAILPSVHADTLQIMKAESPGPNPEKIVPKIGKTAKLLYTIYIAITSIEIILLCIGKMPVYDAFVHAFGSVGTGGFSIKNKSIGAYNSVYIEIVITVFMVACGANFALYYQAIKGGIKNIFKDEEFRLYISVILSAILLITLNLNWNVYKSIWESLRHASFQVASIITTTGYFTVNFDKWTVFSKMILLLLMFIGGCAGSTAGAIKNVRILLLFKLIKKALLKIIHPRAVYTIKFNGKAVDENTLSEVLVYFFMYVTTFVIAVLIVSIEGKDFITTISSVATTLGNVGPGLGVVGPAGNFSSLTDISKVVLSFCMILGRIEIYPILLFFLPSFWKRISI